MGDNKAFWTTVPGILTGLASVVAALTGLLLAVYPPSKETASSPSTSTKTSLISTKDQEPSTWPLVVEETFTTVGNGWATGVHRDDQTPRFERRIFDGKYRWDVEFLAAWHGFGEAPFGPAASFKVAFDVKFVELSNPMAAGVVFGITEIDQYEFQLGTNRSFTLFKYSKKFRNVSTLIGWTPIAAAFDPKTWNRLTVVVNDRLIRFYLNSELLGEINDPGFVGGKVGLAVAALDRAAAAVVDFDNFEFRRRP